MDIVKNLVKSSEEKQKMKTEEIIKIATERSRDIYNIVRIDGNDYVTLNNIPVSLADDAKDGSKSLCDRLETYRKNYVDACVASNRVIGDSSYR